MLAPGSMLGPYEIVDALGAGGMGEVYRARDPRLRRTVAVKVSREQFSERFSREARAVAALNHPNICQIYDVGPDYLVMEYVEGAPPKGPLPLAAVLDYARQIAAALEAAHDKGIVHRDLKPANLLVVPDLYPRRHAGRHDYGHRRLHGAANRRAASEWTSAPTSGRSASCSTSCSPASSCFPAKPPPTADPALETIQVLDVTATSAFRVSGGHPFLKLPRGVAGSLSPDLNRALIAAPAAGASTPSLDVLLNWPSLAK